MSQIMKQAPRVALLLFGVAVGVASRSRRAVPVADPKAAEELKRSLAALEERLAARESAAAIRFEQIETRLDEHAAKLAEAPSTAQIVGAMEQLLARTMSSLDERLTSQANAIDVLKTTVAQTDSLLERVLESLDSFQPYAEQSETPNTAQRVA